jgi:sugar/nucleoside kinase (ribokinase family)
MGKEGVLALTPDETRVISAPRADTVVDTTGCGDVFAAVAMRGLAAGASVFAAAGQAVELASRAVGRAGVRETFRLALKEREK